jgi:XTP/dITP diphosphohydrolase
LTLRLAVATNNPGKLREIELVLGLTYELVPRPTIPEPVEDGTTLLENARIKARAVVNAIGLAAVADDTGLFVPALDGAPGVHTAHYKDGTAFAHGWERLLHELSGVSDRRATFRTVALVVFPDRTEILGEGVCDGTIAVAASGGGGFGYDPVFVPDGFDRTFAEMTVAEKSSVSHRGRAFRALAAELTNL